MIEDLDVIVEPRPTVRQRWLVPLVGAVAMLAVLATSLAQLAPLRRAVVEAAPARLSVLRNTGPASGFRSLELPRAVATLESRTQFSGVTGLTSTGLSEGFRDLYRFPDGRLFIVIEYPDPANGALITPGDGQGYAVTVRGVRGRTYASPSTSMPLVVGWVADGMQYSVGGAAFTTEDLVRAADALR